MLWNAEDFESETGGYLFIQRLSATALVRRPLPDATAALDRYLMGVHIQESTCVVGRITGKSVFVCALLKS